MPLCWSVRLCVSIVLTALLFGIETLSAEESDSSIPQTAATSEVDPVRTARLAERDVLGSEALELFHNGDAPAADELARKVLAIETELFGNDSADLLFTLTLIAQCQEAVAQWDDAAVTRENVLARSLALFDARDFRIADARSALTHLRLLQRCSPDDLRSLSHADAQNKTAWRLLEEEKYADAVVAAEAVRDIRQRILGDSDPYYATSLNDVAYLYFQLGDYARSRNLYENAKDVYHNAGFQGHPAYAGCLHNFADLCRTQADFTLAEQTYCEALSIRHTLFGERDVSYAASLNGLGVLYAEHADFTRATLCYEQALHIYLEKLGENNIATAEAYNNMGMLYLSQSDYSHAAPLLRKALTLRQAILGPHHSLCAQSCNNLGGMYNEQADYSAAESMFLQALSIWKHTKGETHADYAMVLGNLGNTYLSCGDFLRAAPLFRQALAIIAQSFGTRHSEYAVYLANLATLHFEQGDYQRAEPLYKEAADIIKQVQGEHHLEYARALGNLGLVYRRLGDWEEAERLYLECVTIRKRMLGPRHPEVAEAVTRLALLYDSQKDYVRAVPLLREVLDIRNETLGDSHPLYATGLNNLAATYAEMGKYEQAVALYQQALDIYQAVLTSRNPERAVCLHNLALALCEIDRTHEGLEYALEAEAISAFLLAASAGVQSERQQFEMSRRLQNRSFGLLSLARLDNSEAEEVYPYVLQQKGQVFVRQRLLRRLRREAAEEPESELAQAFDELADRTRELDRAAKLVLGAGDHEALRTRLELLTLDVERLQQNVGSMTAEFTPLRETSELSDLTGILPNAHALIDFRAYSQFFRHDEQVTGQWEEQYVAFITRPDQRAQVVWLGPAEAIESAVEAWREVVRGVLSTEVGVKLRQLVWDPLERHLGGVTTVLVSPDGAINGISFGALPGVEPETYLIEERAFITVPAPMLIPDILERDVAESLNPSLLLVGDVDYGSDPGRMELLATDHAITPRGGDGIADWKRLPDSLVEVESIEETFHRVFHVASTCSLRGSGATEQAVRDQAPQATYLHLATHGYFAPKELKSVLSSTRADEGTISLFEREDVSGWHPGLLSGIVLAGANQPPDPDRDDGVLTALEVAELDLSGVELVTLSACETGLGQTAGGEGVLGLQRSFQLAGARTTVASLWEVPDAATRALMVEFYENLWVKQLPRGEALHQAQLTMLREGVDRGLANRGAGRVAEDEVTGRLPPYYWAAFVLSGDWR